MNNSPPEPPLDPQDHREMADAIQRKRIRQMTPFERLEASASLYQLAWEIKKAGLRAAHPDWTEEQVEARTRRIFLTGYAGD